MPGFLAWWLVVRVLGRDPDRGSVGIDLRPLLHPGHQPSRTLRASADRSVVAGRRPAVLDGAVDCGSTAAGCRAVEQPACPHRRARRAARRWRSSPCCSSTPGKLQRRLPRRRPVLRPVGLPDHVAAAGRGRPHRTGRLVAFWGRRFRRLLPAVLLLLVAVTVITTVDRERARARRNAERRSVGAGVRRQLARHRAATATTGHRSSCRGCSATCGAWRSRSSSTSCGRWSSASSPGAAAMFIAL